MAKSHFITGGESKARIDGLTVRTIVDRDAIPAWRRKWKMIVGVYDDGQNNGFYSLEFGLTSELLNDNGNWSKGTVHAREHTIDSPADHLPSTESNRGKFIRSNPTTGKIEFWQIDYEIITEQLTGVVDGINTVFSTTVPYKSGTISVFVNGLKEKYFDEISETQIQLKSAPSNIGIIDSLETIYTKKTI